REEVHAAAVRKLGVKTSRRALIPAHSDGTEVSVPIFRDTGQTVDTPRVLPIQVQALTHSLSTIARRP
ncbi:MAG: hypothetical protein WAT84_05375, partial [Candidatus Moraniibacteriota bacterium]